LSESFWRISLPEGLDENVVLERGAHEKYDMEFEIVDNYQYRLFLHWSDNRMRHIPIRKKKFDTELTAFDTDSA